MTVTMIEKLFSLSLQLLQAGADLVLAYSVVFVITLIPVWLMVWIALVIMRRKKILDQPNERSLHQKPIPRGGGLGVMAGMVPIFALLLLEIYHSNFRLIFLPLLTLMVGLAFLTILSFRDDRKPQSAWLRIGAQALTVSLLLVTLPLQFTLTSGLLPFVVERFAIGFALLWFTNLYNFMDGIDGISGIETVTIGMGSVLAIMVPSIIWLILPQYFGVSLPPFLDLSAAQLLQETVIALGFMLTAAGLGFLFWNWSPAKVFLGDSGSVPLGLLCGFVLLALGLIGFWQAALILPLYYLGDASLTLLRRLIKGEKIWQAHRSHFYQRAVQGGYYRRKPHAQVSLRILYLNFFLIGLATAAPFTPYGIALVLAVLLVGWRLWHFNRHGGVTMATAPSSTPEVPATNSVPNSESNIDGSATGNRVP